MRLRRRAELHPEPVTVSCPPGHVGADAEPPTHLCRPAPGGRGVQPGLRRMRGCAGGARAQPTGAALARGPHLRRAVRAAHPRQAAPPLVDHEQHDQLEGLRARLRFLERLRGGSISTAGGANPSRINGTGLPYRYSLAVENFRGPYYWTEKLADCFLAWFDAHLLRLHRIDVLPAGAWCTSTWDDPHAVRRIVR